VLAMVPGQPVKMSRFHRLCLDEYLEQFGASEYRATVRLAASHEMESLVRLRDKRTLFLKRFAAGDYCLLAIQDDKAVGYAWFSARPEHIEERYGYRFQIPPDSLYVYDVFVDPSQRRRGFWRQLMAKAGEILKKEERRRIIAHIEYGNHASMQAHRNYGFIPVSSWFYIKLLWIRYLRESPCQP
jgi:L-amino acid N-acyltransferase YncA